jgi:hypothetical protein
MLSLSLDLNEDYRFAISEMSRQSQLELSAWYNDWILDGADNLKRLQAVTAISTKVVLASRHALYRKGEKLPAGTYEIEDGFTMTLPLTEAGVNELPLSFAAWLIDAAGRIHPYILETFLAAGRRIEKAVTTIRARPSASGQSDRSIKH